MYFLLIYVCIVEWILFSVETYLGCIGWLSLNVEDEIEYYFVEEKLLGILRYFSSFLLFYFVFLFALKISHLGYLFNFNLVSSV